MVLQWEVEGGGWDAAHLASQPGACPAAAATALHGYNAVTGTPQYLIQAFAIMVHAASYLLLFISAHVKE